MLTVLSLLALVPTDTPPWQQQEAAHLRNIKQLTSDFVRAGEGYFSPDGKQIVFQAEEKGTGNPFYQIYVMDLATKRFRRLSPGIGKTTCSYFSPDGRTIIFASSHLDPDAKKKQAAEYKQREEDRRNKIHRRYRWDFDEQMDIFAIAADGSGKLKRLTEARGYDAEGSFSPDGKHIVFCSNRSGEKNLELYIMDADGKNVRKLTNAPGCYNGGPFFSPDGKRVIFRSDRKKRDHLQLYVINVDGSGERALTDDLNWVQWGPYWYKDSKHIIYAGADHSNPMLRPNYDLYWIDVDEKPGDAKQGRIRGLRQQPFGTETAFSSFSGVSGRNLFPFRTGLAAKEEKPYLPKNKVRLTFSPAADVLPVFSPDGKKIMWTSTRTADGSSQLFIADFIPPKK